MKLFNLVIVIFFIITASVGNVSAALPTSKPAAVPSQKPTLKATPSQKPTQKVSSRPIFKPSNLPTIKPTSKPSFKVYSVINIDNNCSMIDFIRLNIISNLLFCFSTSDLSAYSVTHILSYSSAIISTNNSTNK